MSVQKLNHKCNKCRYSSMGFHSLKLLPLSSRPNFWRPLRCTCWLGSGSGLRWSCRGWGWLTAWRLRCFLTGLSWQILGVSRMRGWLVTFLSMCSVIDEKMVLVAGGCWSGFWVGLTVTRSGSWSKCTLLTLFALWDSLVQSLSQTTPASS